jgi:hypothetical protein
MDYADYKKQIYVMAGYTVGTDGSVASYDANYETILPELISYAELRIQRDLDFLSTQAVDTSLTFTISNNVLSIPQSSFITLQTLEAVAAGGSSTPLLPTTKEYIQNVYGGNSTTGTPRYFAMYGSNTTTAGDNPTFMTVLVGPSPDAAYTARLTGTVRFAPLSANNTTTFISTYLPDLFIMAGMIYMSAYQRNFGRISDDPNMAQTYEGQYQALLKGAGMEEFRKKFQASAWSSLMPSPVASPTR